MTRSKNFFNVLVIAASMMLGISCSSDCNTDKEMDSFIEDLMSQMTLQEKIGQLNLPTAGDDIVTGPASDADISKLLDKGLVGGLFNVKGAEKVREVQEYAVSHHRLGIPLIFGLDVIHGYRTTFPIPLGMAATWNVEATEEAAHIAAVEASCDGIGWTFSPMVDIAHDARWGRIAEGAGEDPYLGSRLAEAYVRGYQGHDLKAEGSMMACVKHYALYGAPDGGRDYNTADMSRMRMFNMYLAPYKTAVDAGVGSLMSAFNEVEGLPCGCNSWLLKDVLRDDWGFKGMVVADYNAIEEMTVRGLGGLTDCSAKSLKAGMDMDMVTGGFVNNLEDALEKGLVEEADIDQACRRILEMKYKLGLFDDPYKFCNEEKAARVILSDEHRAIARKTAAESFVLLKNKNNLLPLDKTAKIAVIGPIADNKGEMLGTWSVASEDNDAVSILEGLTKASQGWVCFARGCQLCYDETTQLHMSAANLNTPEKSVHRDSHSAEILKGEAIWKALSSDVIVAVLGESKNMSGEGASRTDISIPDAQKDLLKALKATGKPIVLVLTTGRPLTLTWEDENVDAILNIWFPGTEAGDAVADVIFGEVSPSGKLPVSFPRSVGQLPFYYNASSTGRPANPDKFARYVSNYIDESVLPLYPFGYGLSYTTFEYGEVKCDKAAYKMNEVITVSAKVTNSGKVDGYETVQLYVRDVIASVSRPLKELKGFEKVFLKAGESKTVTFSLNKNDLSFYDNELVCKTEAGEFQVSVGGDSNTLNSTTFTISE